jgi:hypothetical protein
MEKNGALTSESASDYRDKKGHIKKASYYDASGFGVADKDNKHKLKKPVRIEK